MKTFYLTIVFGMFYAAALADEYVSFVNDARAFTCHGKSVRWYLPNGSQVPDNSTKYEVVANGDLESQLTVRNISPIDFGDYRCAVGNKTEKFELKVYYPMTVDAYPSAVAVRQNHDLSLKCRSNGVPQAQIKWYHEEDELAQDSVFIINGNELTVKQIQPKHAGTYTCLAIQKLDSFKNILEREIEVVVEYAPIPVGSATIVSYHSVGSTATIQCHSKAVPNASFKWVRKGYEIFEGVTNFNDDSRLTIRIDSPNSLGNYSCEASNKYGDVRQVFQLKDKSEEPQIKSGSKVYNISVSLLFFTLTSIIANLYA